LVGYCGSCVLLKIFFNRIGFVAFRKTLGLLSLMVSLGCGAIFVSLIC